MYLNLLLLYLLCFICCMAFMVFSCFNYFSVFICLNLCLGFIVVSVLLFCRFYMFMCVLVFSCWLFMLCFSHTFQNQHLSGKCLWYVEDLVVRNSVDAEIVRQAHNKAHATHARKAVLSLT